jgi:hypothetical protein
MVKRERSSWASLLTQKPSPVAAGERKLAGDEENAGSLRSLHQAAAAAGGFSSTRPNCFP